MTERPSPLLDVRDATISYRVGGRTMQAVDRVSLRVAAGEVVGLVGGSGSGKSSLARAICGLEKLSSGAVLLEETNVHPLGWRRRPAALRDIQLIFQNPDSSLNPRRRVGAQIADGIRANAGRPGGQTVAELLSDVGLDEEFADRFPHQLSGGQRQRVAISRAIAARPRLLIADEPIAALDASLQLRIATLLRDLAVRSGAGLLLITHDLAIVRAVTDRMVVLSGGRVVEEGPTEQIWLAPQHAYTRRLIASVPIADGLGRLPGLGDDID